MFSSPQSPSLHNILLFFEIYFETYLPIDSSEIIKGLHMLEMIDGRIFFRRCNICPFGYFSRHRERVDS